MMMMIMIMMIIMMMIMMVCQDRLGAGVRNVASTYLDLLLGAEACGRGQHRKVRDSILPQRLLLDEPVRVGLVRLQARRALRRLRQGVEPAENASLCEFFLCLSRACLSKIIVFYI
jgi:hypothetical protein